MPPEPAAAPARMAVSDEQTLAALRSGDERAFRDVFARSYPMMKRVARAYVASDAVAEEVVQETFLALWNRAEAFDPGVASLGTWLRSIARNRTVDRLRAAGRRPQLVALPSSAGEDDGTSTSVERLDPDLAVFGGAVRDPDPVAAAEAGDLRRAIAGALADMPEDERTVILLAYQQELSQSEIAARLGWPLGTVKTRTRRALARMRALLDREDLRMAGQGGVDGPR